MHEESNILDYIITRYLGLRKFKELEKLVNPLKDQLTTNFQHVSTVVNEIKVKGNKKMGNHIHYRGHICTL